MTGPKVTAWPTSKHVRDSKTGAMYRIWNALGPNGTDIELLVRSVGFSRETGDRDGITTWLSNEGLFVTSLEPSGDLPEPTLQSLGGMTKN